ncbi:putative peptidoglycan lipid II flippase [Knoellia remsis]|uniref:Putative peptidoglycan lipid II flippase n=1 Tax=Knoellia remsis TaxID=407159 RepID=A0A2T0V0V2_9MICO|nr:lipid II flippase MurJ [Knoellia remsis]PRY63819.1 putative peptidoglycan lipid II flippase [Knoellia remsis]
MTARAAGQSLARAALVVAVATLLARIAGSVRTLVFSGSVGASPVGDTYQTVNTLPNVVYEVAAGGALAAIAVPLVAGRLGAGEREESDRSASALLTWAVAVLVPLTVIVLVAAPWLSELLLDDSKEPGSVALGTDMLRIFAPQVALYGIGVVLAGVLQAHRRFLAAALAPLLSSIVVMTAYVIYGRMVPEPVGPDVVDESAVWVLAGGTTLGVVVLSLPLVVPALRAGVRLRPTFAFPGGLGRRAARLAAAGVIALAAQQAAVALTLWLTQKRTLDTGAVNIYAYVQAVYLLPYAVLAVPIATAAFPALAHTEGAAADGAAAKTVADGSATLARSLRGILLLTSGAAAALMAVSKPVGEFFLALDRGSSGPGREALAALPGALVAYAPGLVGFSVAALLTRALYVRGQPVHAALAVAAGWLIAGLVPFAVIPDGSDAATTLGVLGVASTVGMTTSAVLLAVLTWRSWGAEAIRGAGRTLGAAVVATAVAIAVGDTVARSVDADGIVVTLLVGIAVGGVTMLVHLLVMAVADRQGMRELRDRGRARRRKEAQS